MNGYRRCGIIYRYNDYYSAIKKNEVLPFGMIWMELESIMLSKTRQRRTKIPYGLTPTWNLRNKTNQDKKRNRETETDSQP